MSETKILAYGKTKILERGNKLRCSVRLTLRCIVIQKQYAFI